MKNMTVRWRITERLQTALKVSQAIVLVLATIGSSCRSEVISPSQGSLHFEVDVGDSTLRHFDFQPVFQGAQRVTVDVRLVNEGRATLALVWKQLSLPLQANELPSEAPIGVSHFKVNLFTDKVGQFESILNVASLGDETNAANFKVTAQVKTPSLCTPKNDCRTSIFNPDLGRCIESNLGDGLACQSGSACLIETTCQRGECVGKARTCNDNNACTVDVCQVETGCEFLPAPPCPGDGKCQVGICDAISGCGLAPAEDGKQCGPIQSCNQAQVCIAGDCVLRDPPDGYVCAEETPCSVEGRCVSDECVPQGNMPMLALLNCTILFWKITAIFH
jgi:hypothetical protein